MFDDLIVEELRYFDHYLKGIPNGIDTEPPVTLYVMGKGLRAENEWPLSRQIDTDFYFADGAALSKTQVTKGSD